MQNLDWDNLGFEYLPVRSHIRYTWENGEWSKGVLKNKDSINLSIAATCLHYGQAAFEGLKAFRNKKNVVKVFRINENAKRINKTLDRILAPNISESMFEDAIRQVVKDNIDYVPPYESGGSLYIRPLVIGSGAQIGISPGKKYEFIVLVTPVGPYYKGGVKAVNALIVNDFDRAAPLGTGNIKIAGNYAASLKPNQVCKDLGFQIALYLNSSTRTCIEEFGTSNFIAVTKNGTLVTPNSKSILQSITKLSLLKLAEVLNIDTEQREIKVEELDLFTEVGACGTAVVITPIGKIAYFDKIYSYGDNFGPIMKKLYNTLRAIQYGDKEDIHNWMTKI